MNYLMFFSRKPLTKWTRDRLVLLGDAAHLMLQYAAQALEHALAAFLSVY
jgi:2-polyprenyl-6-methoxyphenol hydroxylase-like FAD-dependent oxidoreductase